MSHIQSISAYLAAALPEMAAFCARLIQTPSVNGQDDELDVAQVIAAQAHHLGLHAELVSEHPRRPNVMVSTAPSGPVGLLLVGHLDTVPPGDPTQWTHAPFAGHTANGKIFGRGAADTKGGMAAALYALAALARTPGALPHGRAQFIGLPNEESGATGHLGVNTLRRLGRLAGQGAIYVYAGQDITLGHRGLVRLRLTALGQAAHTGLAGAHHRPGGINAVTGLADVLLRLEQVDLPASRHKYFDRFRAVLTPGTVVSGGAAVNMVPDRAEALVDVRTIPEFSLPETEALVNRVAEAVQAHRPGLRITVELLNHLPPAISNETAPLFAAVEQAARQVWGRTPPRVVAGPANEGYLFIEAGIPMVCGFGPRGGNAHSTNEFVEVDSLAEAALVYALTAQALA